MKPFSFLFALMHLSAIAWGQDNAVIAREDWRLLAKGELKLKDLAIHSTAQEKVLGIVRENLSFWQSKAQNYHDLVVLDQYTAGDYGVVLLGMNHVNLPHEVSIMPLCMVKMDSKWRLAPMLSNFDYIKQTQYTQNELFKLNEWIDKQSSSLHKAYEEKKISDFQQSIEKKRLEILDNCSDSRDLVEFFLHQVNERSVAGVMAVVGIDMKSPKLLEADTLTNELYLSIVNGLDTRVKERGGWEILMKPNAIRCIVSDIDSPEQFPQGASVGLALAHPSFDQGIQLAEFEVIANRVNHALRLPAALLMTSYEGKELHFEERRFDHWALSVEQENQTLPKMEKLLLSQLEGQKITSANQLNTVLYQTRIEGEFPTWLSLCKPYQELSEEDSKKYLQVLLKKWKDQSSTNIQKLERSYFSDKKDKAVYVNTLVNTVKRQASFLEVRRLSKHGNSWYLSPYLGDSETFVKQLADSSATRDLVNVDVQKSVQEMFEQITVVRNGSQAKKNREKAVYIDSVTTYLDGLQQLALSDVLKGICRFEKNEDWLLRRLGCELEMGALASELKAVSVVTNEQGLALVAVEALVEGRKTYLIYPTLSTESGVYVDMQNRLFAAQGNEVEDDVNDKAFEEIQKTYHKQEYDFILSHFKSLRSLLVGSR